MEFSHPEINPLDLRFAISAGERVPPAGVPKDGNRADQWFLRGSLVIEASFGVSSPE